MNEEKKITDEELAKALLKSIEYGKYITYFDDWGNCKEIKVMDIIDLINRLKCNTKLDSWKNKFLNALKEKEELQKDYIELDLEARELRTKIDELTELQSRGSYRVAELGIENAELQKQVDELKLDLENWKKAAYGYKYAEEQAVKDTAKEIFAELLKDENVHINVRLDQWGETYNVACVDFDTIEELAKERYGVEVE